MKKLLSVLLLSLLIPTLALADGRELAVKKITELETLAAGSVASGDFVPVYDASARKVKKVAAQSVPFNGAFNGTVGATTPNTGVFTSIGATLAITDTRAPTADSATTNNAFLAAFTTPIDTTGTNIHNAFNVSPTISNATGGTNSFNGYNFDNVTGDAQVNITGVNIGTGTRLGTSRAIVVSTGWDTGLDITNTAAADSAATDIGIDLNLTTPVDTTGTNTHIGLNIDTTIGNATAGTNTATAINIANVSGDAQVTESAIIIGTGFDSGITANSPVTFNGDVTMDGGDQLVGYLQNQITSTTTNLTAAQCGSTIINDSADVLTLPEASTVLGCRYTFVVENASNLDINPADGTDLIRPFVNAIATDPTVISPSAGDAIRCATVGGSITLEAVSANAWVVVGGVAGQIWSDVN